MSRDVWNVQNHTCDLLVKKCGKGKLSRYHANSNEIFLRHLKKLTAKNFCLFASEYFYYLDKKKLKCYIPSHQNIIVTLYGEKLVIYGVSIKNWLKQSMFVKVIFF